MSEQWRVGYSARNAGKLHLSVHPHIHANHTPSHPSSINSCMYVSIIHASIPPPIHLSIHPSSRYLFSQPSFCLFIFSSIIHSLRPLQVPLLSIQLPSSLPCLSPSSLAIISIYGGHCGVLSESPCDETLSGWLCDIRVFCGQLLQLLAQSQRAACPPNTACTQRLIVWEPNRLGTLTLQGMSSLPSVCAP